MTMSDLDVELLRELLQAELERAQRATRNGLESLAKIQMARGQKGRAAATERLLEERRARVARVANCIAALDTLPAPPDNQ